MATSRCSTCDDLLRFYCFFGLLMLVSVSNTFVFCGWFLAFCLFRQLFPFPAWGFPSSFGSCHFTSVSGAILPSRTTQKSVTNSDQRTKFLCRESCVSFVQTCSFGTKSGACLIGLFFGHGSLELDGTCFSRPCLSNLAWKMTCFCFRSDQLSNLPKQFQDLALVQISSNQWFAHHHQSSVRPSSKWTKVPTSCGNWSTKHQTDQVFPVISQFLGQLRNGVGDYCFKYSI